MAEIDYHNDSLGYIENHVRDINAKVSSICQNLTWLSHGRGDILAEVKKIGDSLGAILRLCDEHRTSPAAEESAGRV